MPNGIQAVPLPSPKGEGAGVGFDPQLYKDFCNSQIKKTIFVA